MLLLFRGISIFTAVSHGNYDLTLWRLGKHDYLPLINALSQCVVTLQTPHASFFLMTRALRQATQDAVNKSLTSLLPRSSRIANWLFHLYSSKTAKLATSFSLLITEADVVSSWGLKTIVSCPWFCYQWYKRQTSLSFLRFYMLFKEKKSDYISLMSQLFLQSAFIW